MDGHRCRPVKLPFEEDEMISRRIVAALGAVFVFSSIAAAQSNDIVFTVPLNLTQLSPDITKVHVQCLVENEPFQGAPTVTGAPGVLASAPGVHSVLSTSADVDVAPDRRVITTTSVYVPIGAVIVGNRSRYECTLRGFFASSQTWRSLRSAALQPPFRLSPDPAPITGSITW
jgi:hypothetical protein